MKVIRHLFDDMISTENLFKSCSDFKRGKRKRKDIQRFERRLEEHIFELHESLATLQYRHGPYHEFDVFDPKERHISGASVKDRLVHQMVFAALSPVFDRVFIFHSFSSRLGKGTHQGVLHLNKMIQKVSANGKKPCYAVKMDIRRFFDSIDHALLKSLFFRTIRDEKMLHLIDVIIDSFETKKGKGIPLGNVTSQLFGNIYLHQLDEFIKHDLRIPYYLRFCDDFIIVSGNLEELQTSVTRIRKFLRNFLYLELHPQKVIYKKLSQGIDFLGYVLFQKYSLLRIRTKKRMLLRLKNAHICHLKGTLTEESMHQKLQSYLGILSHANQHTLSVALKNAYGVTFKKQSHIEAALHFAPGGRCPKSGPKPDAQNSKKCS